MGSSLVCSKMLVDTASERRQDIRYLAHLHLVQLFPVAFHPAVNQVDIAQQLRLCADRTDSGAKLRLAVMGQESATAWAPRTRWPSS